MILFISLTTLVLTVVQTFYNYKINKNGLFLAGFLIPLSFSGILHHYFLTDNSAWKLALVYGHFMPLFYLAGPMLYFYIKSTIRDEIKIKKLDYLHFLPFVISLISILPYFFKDFESKIVVAEMLINDPNYSKQINISWLYNDSLNLLGRPLFLFGYFLVCLYWLVNYSLEKKNGILADKQKLVMTNWLYSITVIAGMCSVSYLSMTMDFFNGKVTSRNSVHALSLYYVCIFFFSVIPLLMVLFPQVLYGIPIPKLEENTKNRLDKINDNISKPKKSIKKLEQEERQTFQKLAEMVVDYLKTQKPFTDPNYSIDDLANDLNIQKHHLYYCFNTILNSRFTTIRTQMRVEYAKECLLNGDLNTLSMEGIWTKTGFSSRTNFFVSFKEVTGMTPLDYIKNVQLENAAI